MSDALTDITPETAIEEDPHGRHRGEHLSEEETPEPAHGRHRKAEM